MGVNQNSQQNELNTMSGGLWVMVLFYIVLSRTVFLFRFQPEILSLTAIQYYLSPSQ